MENLRNHIFRWKNLRNQVFRFFSEKNTVFGKFAEQHFLLFFSKKTEKKTFFRKKTHFSENLRNHIFRWIVERSSCQFNVCYEQKSVQCLVGVLGSWIDWNLRTFANVSIILFLWPINSVCVVIWISAIFYYEVKYDAIFAGVMHNTSFSGLNLMRDAIGW